MNPDIKHPCGRLFALERSLDVMAQDQLALAAAIDAISGSLGVSEACETLSMNAIVMAGVAKRLQEIRHYLDKALP